MAQIARDLGVDAVATVKLDLMKKKEKGFFFSIFINNLIFNFEIFLQKVFKSFFIGIP